MLAVALDHVRTDPVLALHGPRTVGKSTLLRELADSAGARLVDLDDPATRNLVRDDPSAFVRGNQPVCIDEYQHVPQVLDAIKAELNRDTRPGRFVLTGSTRYDALPRATQSLTGRIHVETIRPLTQSEIEGCTSSFLEEIIADARQAIRGFRADATREEYAERITKGGLPLALTSAPNRRSAWFEDYVRASLHRDVQELAKIRQADELEQFLARLAAQTGQLLNVSNAAQAAGVETRTAATWERLLESLFLVHRLPAWGRTAHPRAGRLPKIHVVDSGVGGHLQRLSPERLARLSPTAMTEFGHLLESFVVNELLAQASWLDDFARAFHWRTRGRDEVDLVIEGFDGRLLAFEVKASGRVHDHDLAGLRALRTLVGKDFFHGIVLCTGQFGYATDDGLLVCPIQRLWRS